MERVTTMEIKDSWFGEDRYGLYKDGFLGSTETHYDSMLELLKSEKQPLRVQMEKTDTKQKTEKDRESREDGAEDQSKMERANMMGKKDSCFGEDRVGQNSNGDAGDCRKRKDEQFPNKDQMSSPKQKLRIAQWKPLEKDSDDDLSDESIDELFIPYHQRTESEDDRMRCTCECDWSDCS